MTLSASLSGEEPAAGMVEVTPSTGRICVSVFPSGDAVAEIAEGASGAPLLRLPISPPKGGAPTTAVPRAAACTDDAALASRLATAADGRFVLTVRPAAGAPVTGQGPLAMSATSG